ncbi:hypothetical protein G7054_g8705 [Neopestalotiopsis clavispora]|nr:hypothetical protein G7054_g8705 [Neopestalotiopsis clavispora]
MASQSTYLTYKRETAELLYWIIKASNSIIQKTGAAYQGGLSLLNTTGKTTVQGLLSMHIGEQTVPPVVYRLFRSVIKARETTHRFFLQLAAEKFDPEIEKSNESHKHFISVLYEAFKALGGDLEPLGTETDVGPSPRAAPIKRGHPNSTTETPENNNVILLANKFASLYLGTADDDKEEEEGGNASDATSAAASIQKSQKKSHGKRKKGVRGRKSKQKKNSTKPDVKESTLDGIPIESYRIIEDEEGIMTDYVIATYSLTFEWMSLRSYLQDTWYEVAYDGLNSAVAGALSNVAISMLKRSELAMHVDFPGHDTFHTVVNTITRGGMGDTQENLKLPKFQLLEHAAHQVEETTLDVKEQFMIYAYNDLLDFLGDFQKKRNGRPTKSMLADIDDWDPSLDLQQATPKERLKWRRCYTINWLYDLVNVFSVAAVHERARNGQEWAPEQVDWSTNGTWNHFRRIFGLREFAREVTSLAMQKQGTDIRNKIQPHMVFQLQCIVDSFMVSRGFSTDIRNGQVLSPPAHHFRPRRDVDAFLDRGGESMGNGFIPSFIRLGIEVEGNISMNRCPDASGYAYCIETLTHLENAFHHWLGITCYASGFEHLPPSRFSKTNENGLWEYSPFTCGVGLVEGLELAYQHGLMVLDQAAEPLLLGHLHNMLLQKGYIDQPLGLFWKLQHIFPDAFFNDSKVPISNYQSAMKAKILLIKPSHNRSRFLAKMRENVGVDLQERYGVGSNSRFKNPSPLTLYRKAAWNHERIPDSDIDFFSRLATLR